MLIAMALAAAELATPPPKCFAELGVEETFARLADMPEPVRKNVLAHGKMAEPGQPYEATDVIMSDNPRRSFVIGGRQGDYFFVWFRQGGFSNYEVVYGYELLFSNSKERRDPTYFLVGQFKVKPCAALAALFQGVGTYVEPPDQF